MRTPRERRIIAQHRIWLFWRRFLEFFKTARGKLILTLIGKLASNIPGAMILGITNPATGAMAANSLLMLWYSTNKALRVRAYIRIPLLVLIAAISVYVTKHIFWEILSDATHGITIVIPGMRPHLPAIAVWYIKDLPIERLGFSLNRAATILAFICGPTIAIWVHRINKNPQTKFQ